MVSLSENGSGSDNILNSLTSTGDDRFDEQGDTPVFAWDIYFESWPKPEICVVVIYNVPVFILYRHCCIYSADCIRYYVGLPSPDQSGQPAYIFPDRH